MSNLKNNLSYINTQARQAPLTLIEQAEDRYASIVCSIAERIRQEEGREIILLAGPSASGKTTTAAMLAKAVQESGRQAYFISLDNFYLDQDRSPRLPDGTPDFETVHALDLPLIDETLNRLLREGRCEAPLFDFTTGRRRAESERIMLARGDVIVVEGLHALNPLIEAGLPGDRLLRVYVNISSRIYDDRGRIVLNKRNLRFVRRMIRDYHYRSSTVDNTFRLWAGVRRGEDAYLFPFKDRADVRINSIHLYEPCLFRDEAISLLREIDADSPWYADARRLAAALGCFQPLPHDMAPQSSLLREFLGRQA